MAAKWLKRLASSSDCLFINRTAVYAQSKKPMQQTHLQSQRP